MDELRSYWDERAASFGMDAGSPDAWGALMQRQLRACLPHVRHARILDIGCGPGAMSLAMARLGHEVVGIDFSSNMVELARRNAAAEGLEARFMVADAGAPPFPAGSFDAVIHRNVMWNMTDPDAALAGWGRVLADGGLLMYFDSAWYGYLHDEAADRLRALRYGTGTSRTYSQMERQAYGLPLSWADRPAWDVAHLDRAGFEVLGAADVSAAVWSAEECERYAFAPQFMVVGRKHAADDGSHRAQAAAR